MQKITITRHIRNVTLAAGLVCLGAAAMAVPEAQFQSAFKQFMQANAGDTAAIEGAAEAFSGLLNSEPANPVLMAYTGATTAMKAANTMMPWKKMSFAEDGLSQLDKALAMLNPAHDAPVQNGTPGVLEVKYVAANTFLAVPGFMNRNERGAKLLGEVVAHPLFATAPIGFKGAVWLKAAKEANKAKNTAEAKRYLDLIVQQQAPQATQAQALLKDLSS
ncbi:MAG: hypothetical protein V4858_00880 [Pseudomonadota bacterium]